MFSPEEHRMLFDALIALVLALAGWLVKRVYERLDRVEHNIERLQETSITPADLDIIKELIHRNLRHIDISEDRTTRRLDFIVSTLISRHGDPSIRFPCMESTNEGED